LAFPPSDFEAAFQEHAMSRVRDVVDIRSHFVGLGLYGFTDAVTDAVRFAGSLGAYHLPPDRLMSLEDRIMTSITTKAAAVQATVAAMDHKPKTDTQKRQERAGAAPAKHHQSGARATPDRRLQRKSDETPRKTYQPRS
jgi:hypothetical protein